MSTQSEAGRSLSSSEEAAMSGERHQEPSALALGAVSALRAYGEAIQRRVASSATPSSIPPEMEKDCCRTPRDEQGHAQNCRPPSERTRLIREQQRDATGEITAVMVSGDSEGRVPSCGTYFDGAYQCTLPKGHEGDCASKCRLGWWAISGDALLDALRRVRAGQDPDLIYAELYANSEQEDVR